VRWVTFERLRGREDQPTNIGRRTLLLSACLTLAANALSFGAQVEQTMRTLRSRCTWASWLALLALALQLVSSFGHIHPGQLRAATAAAGLTVVRAAGPIEPARSDEDGVYCTLCASILLAGLLLIPLAPAIATRRGMAPRHSTAVMAVLMADAWGGPHARGPPAGPPS
jgi:hypothetical protein